MSEILREQSSYRKGKTPIINKYLVDHKKIFNVIAGRGFLNLPGYAYDVENQLELAAKMGLSELNYKILAETIEREIKQTGLDYNNSYATAMMAWEVEKQALIAAWDAELAGIKQGMVAEEEVLNHLAIEVDARQAVLITAKTALDVEMEGYRTQLAQLDSATASYEVQLANAKLLTAQKKLELLPIIDRIIAKEQELIALEQNKATYYSQLMAAEQEVANKKQQLVPGLAELANKTMEYANLIPSQIGIEQQIAQEKLTQANVKKTLAGKDTERLEVEIDAERKNVDISAAKRNLNDKKFENDQSLTALEIRKDTDYQNDANVSFDTIIQDERATQAQIISNKTEINTIENRSDLKSAQTIVKAGIDADNSSANAEAYGRRRVAEIEAASQITAQLTHLIG